MTLPESKSFTPRPSDHPATFAELVASRKAWLDDILRIWCQRARHRDLLLAEQEWIDIAGKVDPEKTLWAWAWSRFPDLIHPELGIDESQEIVVTLGGGPVYRGYADARRSRQGKLCLLQSGDGCEVGPFLIDEIAMVQKSE